MLPLPQPDDLTSLVLRIDVSANLTIGNLDLEEFADATDATGTYRGMH
ncbi:hypothetical protein AB0G04_10600 [Actinoplanes sp. NPDC023801]